MDFFAYYIGGDKIADDMEFVKFLFWANFVDL